MLTFLGAEMWHKRRVWRSNILYDINGKNSVWRVLFTDPNASFLYAPSRNRLRKTISSKLRRKFCV